MLENQALDDRQIYLVQLAKSWADDGEETRRTRLCKAVLRGDGVKEALNWQPWAINELDYTGLAPIHLAVKLNNNTALDALINAGADVNQKDFLGWTPLMHAAYLDRLEFVKCLLAAKCRVGLQANSGFTALHAAVQFASPDVTHELLRRGASSAVRTESGRTPLHDFSFSDQPERVLKETLRLLLTAKGDLEACDHHGYTPVLSALAKNNLPALRCLVQAGASLHAVDKFARNILHHAAAISNLEMLQYLRDQKLADINTELIYISDSTPWDRFILVQQQTSWNIVEHRRPSQDEQQLFAQLCRDIRDRNLQNSIASLEQVGQWLTQMDKAAAIHALDPLIERMDNWNQDALLFDCLHIKHYIYEGHWEMAMEVVNKSVQDLMAEMTSP
jgi:ankyrin repeat protein